MNHSVRPTAEPRSRVVLLGASNLTRGLPVVIDAAEQLLGGPLDVMAALGHGRSYGQSCSVMTRRICGISECALWSELETRQSFSLHALITDVGNDIAYGVDVPQILDWVRICCDHLQQRTARVVLTGLPLESILRVGPKKFALIKRILFPSSSVSHQQALERSTQLHRQLRELTSHRSIAWVEQDARWFGLDPIHIRRRHFAAAWTCCVTPWRQEDSNKSITPRNSLARKLYLASRVPFERRLFWIRQRRIQPCGRLRSGTRISLY